MKYPSATISVGLGARLAQLRAMKGLSQADIVQGELSRAYVSAVERGRITPSLQALELIAARLGEPISVLLGEAATTAQGIAPMPAVLRLEQLLYTTITGGAATTPDDVRAAVAGEELGQEGELLRTYVVARAALARGDAELAAAQARDGLAQLNLSRRVGRELWQMWLEALLAASYLQLGQNANAVEALSELSRRVVGADGFAIDETLALAVRGAMLSALRALGQHDRCAALADEIEPTLPATLVNATSRLAAARPSSPSSGQGPSGPWSPRLVYAKLVEHVRLAASAWQEVALVRQRAGDTERAEHALACAGQLAEVAGDWELAAQTVNLLAGLQLEAGRLDDAAVSARRGTQYAERQPSGWVRGQAMATLARVASARDESAEAMRLYQEAIQHLESGGGQSGKELSDAYRGYGRLLVAQGRVDEGVKLLDRAYATLSGEGRG